MKRFLLITECIVAVSLIAGCATTNQDLPILSTWPSRSYRLIAIITSPGDEHRAQQLGHQMKADALVFVGLNLKRPNLSQPATSQVIGNISIETGGDSQGIDRSQQSYAAIQWQSDDAALKPKDNSNGVPAK